MVVPVLYSDDLSPPCRAVLMLAKAIDLTLDIKETRLLEAENLKPDFVKLNPQHTIPTLDDNGFILWESHAISTYLINKYAKDDSLYPADIQKRAVIDQRLHFDTGVAFGLLKQYVRPLLLNECKVLPDKMTVEAYGAYGFLEAFLEGNQWMCGESLTLADIQLVATVSSIELFVEIGSKYRNLLRWLDNCRREPWYQANVKGIDFAKEIFATLPTF